MSSSSGPEQAIGAISNLLRILGVSRVVFVDDIFDVDRDAEVVAVASLIEPGMLQKALPEFGEVPEDKDVLMERVRRLLWSIEGEGNRRDRKLAILRAASGQNHRGLQDQVSALVLEGLVPEGMLETLTPEEWENRKDQLLQDGRAGLTLFLFDQDLSASNGNPEGGIRIISSILGARGTERLICGLLSHTVEPEGQLERRDKLSRDHGISPDRFVVIAKKVLHEDPMQFAQGLKFVALSPAFAELKAKTKDVLAAAAAVAAESVGGINIHDLDQMVFQVTEEEGLWEPDMLFRLHSLFHRLESRKLAFEGGELEQIASRLRSVSHIPTPVKVKPASSTWVIQKRELYEEGEFLNQHHLPLELGDIFSTEAEGGKHLILLAQPCDLMVRGNGKRMPELGRVPMADVVLVSSLPDEAAKKRLMESPYNEELRFFGKKPEDQWYVRLKTVHHIRVDLLDLCVFDRSGRATYMESVPIPELVRPNWKTRYTKVTSDFFRKRLGQLQYLKGLPEGSQSAHALQLQNEILHERPFKGELVRKDGQQGIEFGCFRVGRLARAQAMGLLMAYTSVLSRPAYERALVQDQETGSEP